MNKVILFLFSVLFFNSVFSQSKKEVNLHLISKKNYIGSPIRFQYIEVAEKDFPNTMNWEDAKKACEELGRGWRLPTKDELNTLYLNKDKIGGFANTSLCVYWSGTKEENTSPWGQYFIGGTQSYYDEKGYSLYVRAIRAF